MNSSSSSSPSKRNKMSKSSTIAIEHERIETFVGDFDKACASYVDFGNKLEAVLPFVQDMRTMLSGGDDKKRKRAEQEAPSQVESVAASSSSSSSSSATSNAVQKEHAQETEDKESGPAEKKSKAGPGTEGKDKFRNPTKFGYEIVAKPKQKAAEGTPIAQRQLRELLETRESATGEHVFMYLTDDNHWRVLPATHVPTIFNRETATGKLNISRAKRYGNRYKDKRGRVRAIYPDSFYTKKNGQVDESIAAPDYLSVIGGAGAK